MKYWIVVASKEHVLKGAEGGFAQVCHGKCAPLQRMKPNDWIIYYSPKEKFDFSSPCQKFTAIGQVKDDLVYPFDMGNGFIPFRRNIHFFPCNETSILPLIDELDFILDKKRWGYPFRFGLFQIQEKDFQVIQNKMLCI